MMLNYALLICAYCPHDVISSELEYISDALIIFLVPIYILDTTLSVTVTYPIVISYNNHLLLDIKQIYATT